MKITPQTINKRYENRGDTIVEVLIAIAIAAFAIGTSYSLANRSLQRTIAARERNDALNIIESQVSDLKFRFKSDPTNFNSGFAVPNTFSPGSFPATAFSFCLHDDATGPSDTAKWPRVDNHFNGNYSLVDNLADTSSGGSYDPACNINNNSTSYFVDMEAQITGPSQNKTNPTVYKVAVRWDQIGSATPNSAVIYYRF